MASASWHRRADPLGRGSGRRRHTGSKAGSRNGRFHDSPWTFFLVAVDGAEKPDSAAAIEYCQIHETIVNMKFSLA